MRAKIPSRAHSFTMKVLIVIAALFITVFTKPAPVQDQLFSSFAGDDHCLSVEEWEKFWLSFDQDGSQSVTVLEFNTMWRQKGLHNSNHAPLFFEELDRIADETLEYSDFIHVFRLFDQDVNLCITKTEFDYSWNALFQVKEDD